MTIKAQQVEFLLSGMRDSTGAVLSGGKVSFHPTGNLSAFKTIWENRNKTVIAANPFTLDSAGRAELFADGVYDIVIKTSTGATVATFEGESFEDPNDSPYFDIANYTSFQAAIASIGATPGTLLVGQDTLASSPVVVPSTLGVKHVGVGRIINGGAATIEFNGPFEAELRHVFSGFAAGDITGLSTVQVKWFWSGTFSDALTKAIGALPATGGKVNLGNIDASLTSTVTVNKECSILGNGPAIAVGAKGATTITKAASLNGPGIIVTANNVNMENFLLDGEVGNGGDGIVVSAGRVRLRNIAAFRQGRDGIRIGIDAGANCNLWYMDNIYAKANGRDGVRISDNTAPTLPDSNGGTLVHLDTQDNTGRGMYLGNTMSNTFLAVTAQTNGSNGVHVSGDAHNNVFIGGDWAENNDSLGSGKDFFVATNATDNMVVNASMSNYTFQDDGRRTLWLLRDGANVGWDMVGLFSQSFIRASTNFVMAGVVGGSLNFTVNGDGADASLALIKLLSDYNVEIGRIDKRVTVNASTLKLTPLSSVPASPLRGDLAIANRVDWDPLAKGSGGDYLVRYSGSAWVAP